MEILTNLYLGFDVAFSLTNLLYCLAGVSIGTLVGVLPGIGPMASISMLLPLMYSIGDPITSIIFLAGIYYGTQYGGSTSSILLNLPGEVASTITALDGYKLTKSGRGGSALAIAALSSFFAGTVTAVIIALVSVPLSAIAFMFTPTDYASLMVLGLLASVAVSQGSFLKGLGMVLTGILLGTVGTDINSGTVRFTFGNFYLADGISFVVVAMAVFGLAEIVYNIFHQSTKKIKISSVKDLYPTKDELKKSLPAMTRGTAIGGILGILPGAGAILSSFCSYIVEKALLKEKNPNGDIEAVAGPEAANNAGAQMSFVPMLALGIPTTAVMSLILAALIMNNIQPGPQVIANNPGLFWGLIVSMWIGNFFLLILNYPLIGIWVSFLKIPRHIMYPIIFLACAAGAYYINNNWFEVWLLIPFMLFGYVLKLLDCEPAPLAMGFVIGTMFEEYLRRSLTISRGDWMIFLDKPISLGFLSITLIFIAASVIIKSKKKL
jgi:TctA family transporter